MSKEDQKLPSLPLPSQINTLTLSSSLKLKQEKAKKKKQQPPPLLPPLQPFSPQEISKFTSLDLALRSHPQLAREGASLLNPRALAKLVHGIKTFQDTHLGRSSKYTTSKSWPITKLPDAIFRSRSSNGPLYTLFLTCYTLKKEHGWKTFDFVSMNRYDNNIILLQKIEQDLIKANFLVRPVCYFDTSVDRELISEYSAIIRKFGGVVVDEYNGILDSTSASTSASTSTASESTSKKTMDNDKNNNDDSPKNDKNDDVTTSGRKKKRKKNVKLGTKKRKRKLQEVEEDQEQEKQNPKPPTVTHVIAWDEEEHDSKETIEQEGESEMNTNNDIVEKLYLRTISIIDPLKEKAKNSNIVETNMMETKKKGGKLGGKGRKGKSPNDPNSEHINKPMAFVHWWYLPISYEEFMLASDVDGDNGDIPPKPDGGPWVVGCKFLRDVEKFNEWGLEADYAITDYEKKVTLYKELAKKKQEEAKRLKEEEELAAKKAKAKARTKSKSPTLRLRVSSNKAAAAGANKDKKYGDDSMQSRQIFTGDYGENNRTKIRRLVYDGALNIPKEASGMVRETIKTMMTKESLEKIISMTHDLPKVGTVLRPSADPKLLSSAAPLYDTNAGSNTTSNGGMSTNGGGFLITELRRGKSGATLVTNRRCVAKDPVLKASLIDSASLQRIRGGGEGEEETAADNEKARATEEDGKSQAGRVIPKSEEGAPSEVEGTNTNHNVDTNVPHTLKSTNQDKTEAMDVDIKKDPEQPIESASKEEESVIANTESSKHPNDQNKTEAMDVDIKKEPDQMVESASNDKETLSANTESLPQTNDHNKTEAMDVDIKEEPNQTIEPASKDKEILSANTESLPQRNDENETEVMDIDVKQESEKSIESTTNDGDALTANMKSPPQPNPINPQTTLPSSVADLGTNPVTEKKLEPLSHSNVDISKKNSQPSPSTAKRVEETEKLLQTEESKVNLSQVSSSAPAVPPVLASVLTEDNRPPEIKSETASTPSSSNDNTNATLNKEGIYPNATPAAAPQAPSSAIVSTQDNRLPEIKSEATSVPSSSNDDTKALPSEGTCPNTTPGAKQQVPSSTTVSTQDKLTPENKTEATTAPPYSNNDTSAVLVKGGSIPDATPVAEPQVPPSTTASTQDKPVPENKTEATTASLSSNNETSATSTKEGSNPNDIPVTAPQVPPSATASTQDKPVLENKTETASAPSSTNNDTKALPSEGTNPNATSVTAPQVPLSVTTSTQDKSELENKTETASVPSSSKADTQEKSVPKKSTATENVSSSSNANVKDKSNPKGLTVSVSSPPKDDSKTASNKTSNANTPVIVPLKELVVSKDDEKDPIKPFSGTQRRTTDPPSWYNPKDVSSMEMTLLSEWFDGSANHRTRDSYIVARERMIDVASKSTNSYVTGTAIRRCVPGDAGSLLRLHQCLLSWGFINGSAVGDHAPTEFIQDVKSSSSKSSISTNPKGNEWSGDMINILAVSVASFATKKRKKDEEGNDEMVIDWESVAKKVGRNVTPLSCYNKFVSTDFDKIKPSAIINQMEKEVVLDDATTITIDNDFKEEREDIISQIIDGVSPSVAQAAIDSALQATGGNISETQNATVLAAVASKATVRATEEEDDANRIMQEILDLRMSKLENRLSLLDDLECMFDAERMALELERRDLYTARCRHWFAGDS